MSEFTSRTPATTSPRGDGPARKQRAAALIVVAEYGLLLALGLVLISLVIGLRAGSDPPPAYAAIVSSGHSVTIRLSEFRDINQLKHRLALLTASLTSKRSGSKNSLGGSWF